VQKKKYKKTKKPPAARLEHAAVQPGRPLHHDRALPWGRPVKGLMR